MAFETLDNVMAYVKSVAFKIGNSILDASGNTGTTTSVPLYVTSDSKLAAGGFPFAVQLLSGATSTAAAVMAVTGSSTLTADDIMHQTLVAGAGVTTWTKTGFIKVNITDSGGNIVNGDHYIQFGTLS
jgi:hypothetical protein